MTGDGPEMVPFGPKRAKHGRLVNVSKWPKRVERGPKWSSQVFLIIWDPFRPMTFLPHMDKVGFGGGALEQKINIFNHMKKYKFLTDPSSEFQTRSSSELVS